MFWAGHTGWRAHNYCLGKKGQATKVIGKDVSVVRESLELDGLTYVRNISLVIITYYY